MATDFGLEIYNPSGVKMLTVTEALTKYVGVVTLPQNANNGSQVFADLGGGRPFAAVYRTSTDPGLWFTPQVTFSGTTAYWTFQNSGAGTSGRAACIIVLGTY